MSSTATAEDVAQPLAPPPAVTTATRKQSAAAALALLPVFIDRHRWGNRNGADEVVAQMITALGDTYPAIATKLKRYGALKPVEIQLPKDIISFEEPATRFEDVVLPPEIADQLPGIIDEHGRAAELAAFHLHPRHKIFLEGPPGNGKTTLAEAFAGELGIPLLRVSYSGLIASHLGETGTNLAKAFRYAEAAPSSSLTSSTRSRLTVRLAIWVR